MSTIGCLTGYSAGPPSSEARQRVLVVDFGAQYAQLTARRVREHSVCSQIAAIFDTTVEHLGNLIP